MSLRISSLLLLISYPLVALDSVNVVTQRVDNQRSSVNLHETQLNHSTVQTRFGRLWSLHADAKVMAQPLYVSQLKSSKCPYGCNTVIFATMKGTVYAYLADQKPKSADDTLVWQTNLGPPRAGGTDIDMWHTDDPWWGVLGTPTVDLKDNLLYVVAWKSDQNYYLQALNLADGKVSKGPLMIEGEVNGVSFNEGSPYSVTQTHKQRAGLLLNNGLLYIAFGGDVGPTEKRSAGWLFIYDVRTLALEAVWSPTAHGGNGGIWMSGNGPVADREGDIYLQTGDGNFDPEAGSFADSLLRLRFDVVGHKIEVLDFFAPCNQEFLKQRDLDFGSSSPLLLPGSMILGAGKMGALYLMRKDNMGKFQPGAPKSPEPLHCEVFSHGLTCADSDRVLQRVNAADGHIHGAPVYWKGPSGEWVYVMGEGDKLKAFPFHNGKLKTRPKDVLTSAWQPPRPAPISCGLPQFGGDCPLMNWMPGGILALSSHGNRKGTGIVWALVPVNGDANSYRGVKGMLIAFNAENVTQELWRSQGSDSSLDTPDSFGLLARFCPPTVANGKVFVATAGDWEPLRRYCDTGKNHDQPTEFPKNYAVVVYGLK